jgi:hypothetical protein
LRRRGLRTTRTAGRPAPAGPREPPEAGVLMGARSIARGSDTASPSTFSPSTGRWPGSGQVAAPKEDFRYHGRPQSDTELSTAGPAAVNNATGVVPNAVHRPVGDAVDGPGPACHRARRHETPGEQRLSLCKGKAEREPAVTGGLVSHQQGKRTALRPLQWRGSSHGQQTGSKRASQGCRWPTRLDLTMVMPASPPELAPPRPLGGSCCPLGVGDWRRGARSLKRAPGSG